MTEENKIKMNLASTTDSRQQKKIISDTKQADMRYILQKEQTHI